MNPIVTDIRRITADEAIEVRWPVLRGGLPRSSAVFDGDESLQAQHFGAYHLGILAGVASIYPAPFPERSAPPEWMPSWRLRGMATLPEVRGAGFGQALLNICERAARATGARLLWCNARVNAVPFYTRFGWAAIGPEFEISGVGPHFRMVRLLSDSLAKPDPLVS